MKIRVVEHGGEEHITEVQNYNAVEVYNQLKMAQSHETPDYHIVIGDVIIDARNVKSIKPVYENM